MWLGVTRLVVNAAGFISNLVLARLLTPDDFGLVAIAASIIAIVNSITELPVGTAIVRHPDPQAGHYDTAFTLNALRGV